jgi:hypothetical protein
MEIGGQGHEGEVVGRHRESGYTYVGMADTMHTIQYSSSSITRT